MTIQAPDARGGVVVVLCASCRALAHPSIAAQVMRAR